MSEPIAFRIDGRLDDVDDGARARLLDRAAAPEATLVDTVGAIIAEVAAGGDAALLAMADRFDGVQLERLEVPREAWREAMKRAPVEVVDALRVARDRIAAFHRRQMPAADEVEIGEGIRLGRRPEPLRTVGAYAPGGRAAYPSSVLMCVVPARLAGVDEIVVCSPPHPDAADGAPPDTVLAACEIAGADRLFAVGGAGAVAALAYGTESVPRADKVVGPGNAYVTEAKRQLAGRIASDCLAGPSELLVVADGGADPEVIARELIAQAEHDPAAIVVGVLTEAAMAPRLRAAVGRLAAEQPRREIIDAALANAGALLVVDDLDAALAFANEFAPEHLLLLVEEPRAAMERVRGAGSIFLGSGSSVVFGDYLSGTNHVLPTGGQGRSQSGLSVNDFLRWSTYQQIDARGAATLAGAAATIAAAEGLDGHAAAARAWTEGESFAEAARPAVQTRPEYAALSTYDPGRVPAEIDLSDNTNLFGQAPSAVRALRELDVPRTRSYPSLYGGDLKRAAARYFGVDEDNVATGCGSDDLIDSTIRAFCRGGDRIAFAHPTFSMIETFARMNGARPVAVDLDGGFELDVEAMAAAGAQVTYLCRPNNPTGNAFARTQVQQLAQRTGGLLIVDEAYGDFCADPLAPWAPRTDRVVVFRTLSKAFGLAGLRVGIAVGPGSLIYEIEKSRGPYKVSVPAEIAATAALRHDGEWVTTSVAQAIAARRRLTDELTRLGLRVFPSAANFILVEAPDGDAATFTAGLAQAGIGVRPFAALPGAGDCVRITVGPSAMMDRLLQRVRELLQR
jgi:histidinol dehydrogenase